MEIIGPASQHLPCVCRQIGRPHSYAPWRELGPARVHHRAPASQPPPPGGSLASGKAEAERSTTVCHVDSVKFREGFPFAGAQEKSSLLPQPPGVPDLRLRERVSLLALTPTLTYRVQ